MAETVMVDRPVAEGDGKVMTVVEHLSELRRRLFI